MTGKGSAVLLLVSLECRVEGAWFIEGISGRIHQPRGGLKGPAATDAPYGIGGQRRVTDQRQTRLDWCSGDVGQVEGAEHRRDQFGITKLRCLGQVIEKAKKLALNILLKGGELVFGRRNQGDRLAVVVWK